MSTIASGFVLGFLLSTIYGAAFHLFVGGAPRKLMLYTVSSWVGFTAGHFIGDLFGIEALKLGAIHLLAASVGSWLVLFLSYFFSDRAPGS